MGLSNPEDEIVCVLAQHFMCPRCRTMMHFTRVELPGGRMALLQLACAMCGQVGHVELHARSLGETAGYWQGSVRERFAGAQYPDVPALAAEKEEAPPVETAAESASFEQLSSELEQALQTGARFELDFGWLLSWIGRHLQPEDVFAESDLARWYVEANEGTRERRLAKRPAP